MRHLDLFAGIGGFSLAAHYEGITTTHAVEINPYCRTIISRHFPYVELWDDICTFEPNGRTWDVVSLGSPCQDLSNAGKRNGIGGDRSSLFFEAMRIVEESHPTFVVWENVEGAINRGLRAALGTFDYIGYHFEPPLLLSAAELGAPHKRNRIFVLAYPAELQPRFEQAETWADQVRRDVEAITHTGKQLHRWSNENENEARSEPGITAASTNTECARYQEENDRTALKTASSIESSSTPVDDGVPGWLAGVRYDGWWRDNPAPKECGVERNSIKNRYQQLEAIGNAVCPEQARVPFRRIRYLQQFLAGNN